MCLKRDKHLKELNDVYKLARRFFKYQYKMNQKLKKREKTMSEPNLEPAENLQSGTQFMQNPTPGTIQRGDTKGTTAAVIVFITSLLTTAWQLYSIMYSERNLYFAFLSVLAIPMIFNMVKTLTGYELQANNVKHYAELNGFKEKLQKKDLELVQLKTKLSYYERPMSEGTGMFPYFNYSVSATGNIMESKPPTPEKENISEKIDQKISELKS